MSPPLSTALLHEVKSAYDTIFELPLNIFVSRPDGSVLFANQRAHLFLNIGENLRDFNVTECYEDSTEREHIVENLKRAKPGTWVENLTAKLNINGQYHWVRYSSKPFFDEIGILQAMLNITESVSEFEWFSDFADDMNAGFFEVDKSLNVTSCNQAVLNILGFNSLHDVIGKSVSSFLWEQGAAEVLLRKMLDNPHIRDLQLRLKRADGAMVIAKMTCTASSWEDGTISRVKGVIRDVTFETLHDDLPVGLFLINDSPNGEVYSQVNTTFAKMHGFQSPSEVIGKRADMESSNAETYASYRAELEKAARNNQPLLDYYMEIQDKNGEKRNVIVNVRHVVGSEGKIRVGAVYDLTDHVGRNRWILEANFSAVLHTYLATVNGLRDTLLMLSRAHGQEFMRDGKYIDRQQALLAVSHHRKRFEDLLVDLAKAFEERGFDQTVLLAIQRAWQNINRPREEFENKEKDSAAWIRRNLIEVSKHLRKLRDFQLKRELTKFLRSEVEEMLRLTSIVSISISIDELNERIPDFNFFRNYLLRGETVDTEVFKQHNLLGIVSGQAQKLEEFASSKGVVVISQFNPRENVPVFCRADLSRAFYSLIHNAIKYSWSKTSHDRQAHVDISIERRREEIEIVIENWGVPIRKDELENEAIMKFGKRGKEADDRGRSGTGIGLYDAREIIVQHKGSLRLTSEPTLGNAPEYYSNPFITRAYITLPIAK